MLENLTNYQLQVLGDLAQRLQDRPVEVLAEGTPADYGLSDDQASVEQLDLLAMIDALVEERLAQLTD